jgi:hypothetical protein
VYLCLVEQRILVVVGVPADGISSLKIGDYISGQ